MDFKLIELLRVKWALMSLAIVFSLGLHTILLSGRTNYHIFKPVNGLQIYSSGEYRNFVNKEMNNRKENANIMTTVRQEYNTPTIP